MHIRAWRRSRPLQGLVAVLVLGAALAVALILLVSGDSGGRVEATDEVSAATATATPTATPTATAEPTATATAAPKATPVAVVLASACGITVKLPGTQQGWGTATVTPNVEDSCRLLLVEVTPAEGYCFAGEGLAPRDPLPTTCASSTQWAVLRWADMTFYVYFAPTTFHYDTFDATAAVTAAGSYAFLTNSVTIAADGAQGAATMNVAATYEDLREEEGLLRLHLTDADGASHADFYATVAVGDILEWRKTDDCFTRYTVTSVPEPVPDAAYREFGVEPMTYAFTGCSGALVADGSANAEEPVNEAIAADMGFGDLPNVGGPSLTAPVVHGAFQLVPEDWSGPVAPHESHIYPTDYPRLDGDRWIDSPTPAELRTVPYWRTPSLPTGWTLAHVTLGGVNDPPFGYTADYVTPDGWGGVTIIGAYATHLRPPVPTMEAGGLDVVETRVIAGRSAVVVYSPLGPNHSPTYPIRVWVFDPATHVAYTVRGGTPDLHGANVDAVIAIAESLFEEE